MSEVATVNNGALVSFIERVAKDPDFDVAKFEALLRMQREVEHDQARKAFNRAMAACQAQMSPIVRTAQNKHLGNKYAKLEAIDQQMRPIYTHHGFSIRFGSAPAPRDTDMRITCTVAHEGGYFEENYLDAPVSVLGSQGGRMAVTPVQAIGSNITYLRRYLTTMCFNMTLIDEDDDGEGSRRPQQQYARQPDRRDMDATLQGDDIPNFDAPRPDRLRKVTDRIKEKLAAAETQDAYNEVLGHAGISAEWAKIREARPELAAELDAARLAALDRITAADQGDAAEPDQEAA